MIPEVAQAGTIIYRRRALTAYIAELIAQKTRYGTSTGESNKSIPLNEAEYDELDIASVATSAAVNCRSVLRISHLIILFAA